MRNLEYEMEHDPIIIALISDIEIAKDFYRALCNMQWLANPIGPDDEVIVSRLKGEDNLWSCSWRSAGGIIADIRTKHYNVRENYLTYYCSGDEGMISDTVKECFYRMGWTPKEWS